MNQMAYWQYFIAIESDLVEASRWVEIAKHNEKTFSIGFAHIILSAGSEIDVLCRLLRVLSKEKTQIDEHRSELLKKYPQIYKMKVIVPRSGWELRPWKAWKNNKGNPPWWKSYNNIKHHRHEHFQDATLANALDTLSGLFTLNLYYYFDKGIFHSTLEPKPTLFGMKYEYDFYSTEPKWCLLPDDFLKKGSMANPQDKKKYFGS